MKDTCPLISRHLCTSTGRPIYEQLCRGARQRWLRACSLQLWWGSASSSCCGNWVEEADGNLWLHPSEGGGQREIHMGNIHILTRCERQMDVKTHAKLCGRSNISSCRKLKGHRSHESNPVWFMAVYWSDTFRPVNAWLDGKYRLSYCWVGNQIIYDEDEGMSGPVPPTQHDSQTWVTRTSCAKSSRIHQPSGELGLGQVTDE